MHYHHPFDDFCFSSKFYLFANYSIYEVTNIISVTLTGPEYYVVVSHSTNGFNFLKCKRRN